MSEQTPDDAAFQAARQQSIDEMADLLQDEFAAVAKAAGRLRETSEVAKKLDDDDLLQILSQLRLGRAMDDFTSIYLDIKDQEVEAAASLLDELEDTSDTLSADLDADFEDDFDDDFDDFDDLDEFDEEDDDDNGNTGYAA